MRVPPSVITCTLTPMRRGGRSGIGRADTSTSAAATGSNSSPTRPSAERKGCRGGKNLAGRCGQATGRRATPRKFSTAGLTITARPSRVNRSRPSSSPPRIWSRFSRSVLKISRTPRNCCPIWLILVLTWPNSSPRSSGFWSNSPREMRSNCAEMRSSGASEHAADHRRQKHGGQHGDERQNNPAERKAGVISMASRPVCSRDANFAEGHLLARSAQLERIGNLVGLRRAIDERGAAG